MFNRNTEKKFDAYEMVTDRICAMLEQGLKPWAMPWTCAAGWAWSGVSGKEYSFINQLLLADPDKKYNDIFGLMADIRGEYLTFEQVQQRGGHVRKGEHGKKIVFYKMYDKKQKDENGETLTDENGDEVTKRIPVLKAYTVFKIDQCEGIEQKYHTDEKEVSYTHALNLDAMDVAHSYITREGITYQPMKGNRACYIPMEDKVITPLVEQFENDSEYYSTLFHELTHSTGHPSRLGRIDLTKCAAFGSEDYSTEELVAEIGAASLCATLHLDTSASLTNSAAYIKNWLTALKNDKKMIVVAAARAEKAIRRILNIDGDGKPGNGLPAPEKVLALPAGQVDTITITEAEATIDKAENVQQVKQFTCKDEQALKLLDKIAKGNGARLPGQMKDSFGNWIVCDGFTLIRYAHKVEGLEEFTPAPGMLATLEKLLHEAVQHGTLVSKMNIGQIKKAKVDIGKAKNVVKLDNDLYVNADYLANIVRLMKDADFYVCRDGKSLPQLYVYDGYYHTEALLMPVRV